MVAIYAGGFPHEARYQFFFSLLDSLEMRPVVESDIDIM